MMTPRTITNCYPLYEKIKNNPHYTRMDVLIDHDVVETLKCDLCGGPMIYEGYGKDMGWGILYRHAFGICDKCEHAVSF